MPSPTPANGPSPIDLTTVAFLQQYLAQGGNTGGGGQAVTGNAPLMQRLVTAASQTARTTIGRNPLVAAYNETYDGTGTGLLTLRNWPVIAVSASSSGRWSAQSSACR